jgi:hypothetical protein
LYFFLVLLFSSLETEKTASAVWVSLFDTVLLKLFSALALELENKAIPVTAASIPITILLVVMTVPP